MGFLKNLFGGKKEKGYVDKTGIYFYAQCGNCGSGVKVRADKNHDLMKEGGGYVWHKTIVDSRCFRRMQAVVYLDEKFEVSNSELSGGEFISAAEYETLQAPRPEQNIAGDQKPADESAEI